MRRIVQFFLIAGLLLVFAAVAAGVLLLIISEGRPANYIQKELARLRLAGQQTALARSIGTDDRPVRFIVNPGDTPPLVAQRLYAASLISNPDLYVDYVLANSLDTEMEAGVYFPDQTLTIPDIARMLTDSRSSFIPFRILEGWRLEEVAAAVDSSSLFGFTGADFLAAVGPGAPQDDPFVSQFVAQMGIPPGASLEGFLFPDTYQLPPQITPTGLRDLLLETFQDKIGPQVAEGAAARGLSVYQVITLASITERESVQADENARIAGVYHNRLAIGMKLDADPTVQYGIGFQNGTWWPQITQADYVNAVSDYNTYLRPGLPPGPIANPGLSAIMAAAFPESHDYFYFRAACNGSGYHNFARTFSEHLANGC